MAIRNFPMPGAPGSSPIRSKALQPTPASPTMQRPAVMPSQPQGNRQLHGKPLDRNPGKPGLGWGGLNPRRQNVIRKAPMPGPQNPVGQPVKPPADILEKIKSQMGAEKFEGVKKGAQQAEGIKRDSINRRKAKKIDAKRRRQSQLVAKLQKSEGKISPKQKARFQEAAKVRKNRSLASGNNPGKRKGWSKAQSRAKFFKTDAFN